MSIETVKWYSSSFEGAPQLGNNWGDLTTMLDAVLVNGFNTKSVTSIERVGTVATITFPGSHGFKVDQVILVAGSDQADYNGTQRVTGITLTTLTFTVDNSPVTPSTGTVTCKTPGLGFDIAFTGTNKRAYRSPNVLSRRPYLRVDNAQDPVYNATYAKYAKVTMAERMLDIDTFDGAQAPFNPADPTRNHVGTGSGATAIGGWYKWYYARYDYLGSVPSESNGATAGNRAWVIIGDDRGFYFFTEHQVNSGGKAGYCFTDFQSYKQGDQYPTLLAATDWYQPANTSFSAINTYAADVNNYFNRSNEYTGKLVMRDHVQLGGNMGAGFMGLQTNTSNIYSGQLAGVNWPNGPDFSVVLHPVYVKHSSSVRGKMPGKMWIHNDNCSIPDQTVIEGATGYAGRKFLVVSSALGNTAQTGNICKTAFDITGPWW